MPAGEKTISPVVNYSNLKKSFNNKG